MNEDLFQCPTCNVKLNKQSMNEHIGKRNIIPEKVHMPLIEEKYIPYNQLIKYHQNQKVTIHTQQGIIENQIIIIDKLEKENEQLKDLAQFRMQLIDQYKDRCIRFENQIKMLEKEVDKLNKSRILNEVLTDFENMSDEEMELMILKESLCFKHGYKEPCRECVR
jgi:lysyl-tRNA synthetase class I